MSYADKLTDFIADMNILLADKVMFPNQDKGRFVLNVNESEYYIEVDILFCHNEKTHRVYRKSLDYSGHSPGSVDVFLGLVWYDFLRAGFFSIDTVGVLKSPFTDEFINVLSFDTLMKEGLKKID